MEKLENVKSINADSATSYQDFYSHNNLKLQVVHQGAIVMDELILLK